jgi:hypothetical protein
MRWNGRSRGRVGSTVLPGCLADCCDTSSRVPELLKPSESGVAASRADPRTKPWWSTGVEGVHSRRLASCQQCAAVWREPHPRCRWSFQGGSSGRTAAHPSALLRGYLFMIAREAAYTSRNVAAARYGPGAPALHQKALD